MLAIVGPGETARAEDLGTAESLGRLAALEGWAVLTGGVVSGVMDAASRGARLAGGLVIGVLPSSQRDSASSHLSVALATDMGQARNNIIILSSDAVAVCGMSPGTAVEAALAARAARPLVFIAAEMHTRVFFERLGGAPAFVDTPVEAIAVVKARLARAGGGA